jgi:hypothetical protein
MFSFTITNKKMLLSWRHSVFVSKEAMILYVVALLFNDKHYISIIFFDKWKLLFLCNEKVIVSKPLQKNTLLLLQRN